MTELALQALVTFLVVIDPVGLLPLFITLTRSHTKAERRREALRGVGVAAIVLFLFALTGEMLLEVLGITIEALRIAGGVLLFLLAIDMLFARQSGLRSLTPGEDDEAQHRTDISVFPLAIPLIAGPGAIVSVFLLMGRAEGQPVMQAIVLAVLLLVLLATLLLLLAADPVARLLGRTGSNVVSRVLGILLAGLAAQFVIDGVRDALLPA